MSDQQQPPSESSVPPAPAYESAPPPPPPAGVSPYQAPGAPAGYGQAGPIGQVRSTGICILLYFVTLGIYGLYWYFKTHEEMKRHSGQGIGGGIALILALFVGIVMPYINSSEVGNLREAPRPGKASQRWDRSLVLPGHVHPRRTVHLVHQDQ